MFNTGGNSSAPTVTTDRAGRLPADAVVAVATETALMARTATPSVATSRRKRERREGDSKVVCIGAPSNAYRFRYADDGRNGASRPASYEVRPVGRAP